MGTKRIKNEKKKKKIGIKRNFIIIKSSLRCFFYGLVLSLNNFFSSLCLFSRFSFRGETNRTRIYLNCAFLFMLCFSFVELFHAEPVANKCRGIRDSLKLRAVFYFLINATTDMRLRRRWRRRGRENKSKRKIHNQNHCSGKLLN